MDQCNFSPNNITEFGVDLVLFAKIIASAISLSTRNFRFKTQGDLFVLIQPFRAIVSRHYSCDIYQCLTAKLQGLTYSTETSGDSSTVITRPVIVGTFNALMIVDQDQDSNYGLMADEETIIDSNFSAFAKNTSVSLSID